MREQIERREELDQGGEKYSSSYTNNHCGPVTISTNAATDYQYICVSLELVQYGLAAKKNRLALAGR